MSSKLATFLSNSLNGRRIVTFLMKGSSTVLLLNPSSNSFAFTPVSSITQSNRVNVLVYDEGTKSLQTLDRTAFVGVNNVLVPPNTPPVFLLEPVSNSSSASIFSFTNVRPGKVYMHTTFGSRSTLWLVQDKAVAGLVDSKGSPELLGALPLIWNTTVPSYLSMSKNGNCSSGSDALLEHMLNSTTANLDGLCIYSTSTTPNSQPRSEHNTLLPQNYSQVHTATIAILVLACALAAATIGVGAWAGRK